MEKTSHKKKSPKLPNMKPSIKALIDIKSNPSESNFRSILSFCKQWNIRDIILKVYDISNLNTFDLLFNAISDTFLFNSNDFDFYVQYENLENSIINKLWQDKENPEDFLLPLLIHNENFEVHLKSFDKEIFRLFGNKPESMKVKAEKKKIKLELKHTESIYAIFVCDSNDNNFDTVQLIDLNKHFNRKTGKIFFPWNSSVEANIYIVRKIFGTIDDKINLKINFLSEKILKFYFNYLGEYLDRHASIIKGWIIDPYKFTTDTKYSLPFSSDFANLYKDKKGKDYSNSILSYFYKTAIDTHHKNVDLINLCREELHNVLKNSYNSYQSSNDKNLVFQLDESAGDVKEYGLPFYLFDFAENIKDFNLTLNSDYILPNGKYALKKEIELRIASSISHHYDNKNVNVICGHLLNTLESFDNKLWYINWLISCGINNIVQKIDFNLSNLEYNLYDNLPTKDPSYLAYEYWFNYIQTLCDFAAKGIHRCDILILYPVESYFNGEVVELADFLPSIANKGIDYDLIDYKAFLNDEKCKINSKKISVNKEDYSILVLPGVEMIPIEVLRKIHDFYSSGGTVIAIGNLPTKSTNWDKDNEIESISNEIWFKKSSISSTKFKTNKWGGKGYFQADIHLLTDIILENSSLLNIELDTNHTETRILVKELPTEYYVILFNMSLKNDFTGTLKSKFKGKPFVWDSKNNKSETYHNFKIENSYLKIPIKIPAKQTKILIIKKQSLKSVPRIIKSNFEEISEVKVRGGKIITKALIKDKGKYELEIDIFGARKNYVTNISEFLPALAMSKTNWNIEINESKIVDNLGDLSRYKHNFSGTIKYKKIIVISEKYLKGYKIVLDLGVVKDTVQIFINNENLGFYNVPPFRLDISSYIKEGDNKFEFRVSNTVFNKLSSLDRFNRKRNYIKEFGLYGPIKLIPYREIEIIC